MHTRSFQPELTRPPRTKKLTQTHYITTLYGTFTLHSFSFELVPANLIYTVDHTISQGFIHHFIYTSLQIERERADLSVQLIALTDRLEDAEGTTDSQVC